MKRIIPSAFFLMLALVQFSRVYAQQAVYVFVKDKCYAIDMHANPVFTFSKDTLDMGFGIVCLTSSIDSVIYSEPMVQTVRIGWWGSLEDGTLDCYYESVDNDSPDMSFLVRDGRCSNAWFLQVDGECPWNAQRAKRVGGKWRYVRNTLSGHRKVRIMAVEEAYNNGTGIRTLKGLLYGKPIIDVQHAVNFWYRPDLISQMPASPIFGTSSTTPVTGSYKLPLVLADDSIYCTVGFDGDGYKVTTDTIRFIFPTEEMARAEFEQMDTHNDDSTRFFLDTYRHAITIVEYFQPIPFDEMIRRLTRFDLDMCRPLFIREDEE